MRVAIIGIALATGALCVGCSPAVGSKEWCEQVIKNGPEAASKLPADQQQKLGECAAKAMLENH